MSSPDIEPSGEALDRIATSVSSRLDRGRRRARVGLATATAVAALLVVAGVGVTLQPATSHVTCYAGADSGSDVSESDLASGDGSATERALAQCTTTATAADARTESGDAEASTLAEPLPEYLVCRRDADYGVLTLDPTARVDPIAACAAIGMEPVQ